MRISISALAVLSVITGLTGCAGVATDGSDGRQSYQALYQSAFTDFVNDNVVSREVSGRTMLVLQDSFPRQLEQMTERIDREAAATGIGSETSAVTRSINRERVAAIVRQMDGKFNSNAYRAADPARLFAENLLFKGATIQYTEFCLGSPREKTYERVYLAGTLIKADCGFFSCFNRAEDALSWKVIRQRVPFLSSDPLLREAELAALNWDLEKARTLCDKGKRKTGYRKVDALIRQYETLKAQILRSRAQTRASVAKWEKIDRERAAQSRQHASAVFLQELQSVAAGVNEAARQSAQNDLTTAIAMRQAATAVPSSSKAVTAAPVTATAGGERDAYLKRVAAVRALKKAELEWKGLWEVVQADLMTLYNAKEEGRGLRLTLARDTEAAKKDLERRKAEFHALCNDERHESALNRYLKAHPSAYDNIVINLSAEEKKAYAEELKARYKPYYDKERRLRGSLPY